MRRDWSKVSWHDVLTLIAAGDKKALAHARRRAMASRVTSTNYSMLLQVDAAVAKSKVTP